MRFERVREKIDGLLAAATPGLGWILHGEVEAVRADVDGGGISEIPPAEDARALQCTLGGVGGQDSHLRQAVERLASEVHRRVDCTAEPLDVVHLGEHTLARLLGEHGDRGVGRDTAVRTRGSGVGVATGRGEQGREEGKNADEGDERDAHLDTLPCSDVAFEATA